MRRVPFFSEWTNPFLENWGGGSGLAKRKSTSSLQVFFSEKRSQRKIKCAQGGERHTVAQTTMQATLLVETPCSIKLFFLFPCYRAWLMRDNVVFGKDAPYEFFRPFSGSIEVISYLELVINFVSRIY